MKNTGKALLTILLAALMIVSSVVTASADTVWYMIGDADGDGELTILDATAIQRHIADFDDTAFVEVAADADDDGEVTILDATAIQRHLAELPTYEMIGRITEAWIDKNKATKYGDDVFAADLAITEIHPSYFFAAPYVPLPYVIKINGSISDHWCVGDHVRVVCNNVWYDEEGSTFPYRYEGDLVSIEESTFVPDPDVAYKPVIYLYPEEETQVNVSLGLSGDLLKSDPLYNGGWTVNATPDGTLTTADGNTYSYLFWEAKLNADYDMSTGFCVKGEDTEAFLNDALNKLGLTQSEADDFIGFWLPIMQHNPYNVISFQTDAYTDAAKLNVSPQPDTVIRVFMAWHACYQPADIPAQELTAPDRSGFTVVEWGGCMVG